MFRLGNLPIAFVLAVVTSQWSCLSEKAGKKMDAKSHAPRVVEKFHSAMINADLGSLSVQEEKAYLAIRYLHHQMDDDHSGNIDLSESDEFIREELNNIDGEKRQRNFHQNDFQISVQELWVSFKKSVVYNWTVDDVVSWLEQHVDLPDYKHVFREKGITGLHLPQLAANQDHFFTKTMGRFPVEAKRKIIIKATDAVIFGPPSSNDLDAFKDAILFITIVAASIFAWLADVKSKETKRNIAQMTAKMASLSKTESDLRELQEQLKGEEQLHGELALSKEKDAREKESLKEEMERVESEADKLKMQRLNCEEKETRLRLAEEELERVGTALKHAEEELSVYEAEATSFSHHRAAIPDDLRLLLCKTYQSEVDAYRWQKKAAENRLIEARDFCGKARKKRDSVFNVMTSSSGDEGLVLTVDARIADARRALEELGTNLRERRQRWQRIEMLCGASLRVDVSSSVSNLDIIDERESSPVILRSSGSLSSSYASSGKRRSVASDAGSVDWRSSLTSDSAAESGASPAPSRNSTPVSFYLNSETNSSNCDLSSASAPAAVSAAGATSSRLRRSSDVAFPRSSTLPHGISRMEGASKDRVLAQSFTRTTSEASLPAALGHKRLDQDFEDTAKRDAKDAGDQVPARRLSTTSSTTNLSKPFSDDAGGLESPSASSSPKATRKSTNKLKVKKLLSKFLSKDNISAAGKEKSSKS